jgi:hypothetical protein
MKLTSKTNASTARWDFHRWQPVVGRALCERVNTEARLQMASK